MRLMHKQKSRRKYIETGWLWWPCFQTENLEMMFYCFSGGSVPDD